LKHLAGSKSLRHVSILGREEDHRRRGQGTGRAAETPGLDPRVETLDGSCFAAFSGTKTLTSLTLLFTNGLTDDGARHIAKLLALDELSIGDGIGERKLTADGIRAIVEGRLPAKFGFNHRVMDDEMFVSLVKKGWLYGPTPPGRRKRPATATDVTSDRHPVQPGHGQGVSPRSSTA